MSLQELIIPWNGEAWRHIPAGSPFGPLDTRFAGRSDQNRWNVSGEPTLYLARYASVVFAEFARHIRIDRNAALVDLIRPRQLFRMTFSLNRVVDLRQSDVLQNLGLENISSPFLDPAVSRSTAGFLRHSLHVEAIVVPSMALLDQPEKWILALFLENLADGLDNCISGVEAAGVFDAHESST